LRLFVSIVDGFRLRRGRWSPLLQTARNGILEHGADD
jgi:hypothetical protein